MKKNLLSVLVLALVLANLILTAILTFSVISEVKKTDALVGKIATAIDLEMREVNGGEEEEVPIEKLAVYNIEESMTINLKPGEDEAEHYAKLSVSLSMNTENEDYEKYGETIAEKESLIKNEVNDVVSSYTIDEIKSNTQAVQDELLERVRKMYDSDFIVEVIFRDVVYQ